MEIGQINIEATIEANFLNKDSFVVAGDSKEVMTNVACDNNSLESSDFVEGLSNFSQNTPEISNDVPTQKNDSAMNIKSIADHSSLISNSNNDSGSDSDVILQEEEYEVLSVSSTDSVEIVTKSGTTINNVNLNTIQRPTCIVPPDDGNEVKNKINLRKEASPHSWSEGVRRHNKGIKRLNNFDSEHSKNIRGKRTRDIKDIDKYYYQKRPVKKCIFCGQVNHLEKDCPKKISDCSMCGNPGHKAISCPFGLCLNCGEQTQGFVELCWNCESERNKRCAEFNQIGHVRSNRPDTKGRCSTGLYESDTDVTAACQYLRELRESRPHKRILVIGDRMVEGLKAFINEILSTDVEVICKPNAQLWDLITERGQQEIIVLAAGTNDVLRKTTPKIFQKKLTQFVKKNKSKHIFLCNIPEGLIGNNCPPPYVKLLQIFNSIINKTISKNDNIHKINVYKIKNKKFFTAHGSYFSNIGKLKLAEIILIRIFHYLYDEI